LIVDQERIADVPELLADLVTDPDRLTTMRSGARSVAKPDAARRVATILKEVTGV